MRLRKIALKNFKRFLDFEAQFSPGINVVKGPLNEIGKSTLLEGIIAALFYNPKSTARWLKDYASWGSAKQCQISLEFENNGTKYLLEKDFDKGTVRFISEDGREELDTFKEISEKMAGHLGTKSCGLFLCSSCIRQSQVSEIESGKKEISENLEEVVSGGKESTLAGQVIQKLDSKITEMKKGLDRQAKNPGILASLKSEIEHVSRRHSEVKEEVSRVEAVKLKLMETKRQLAEIKEQYENAKALLEKNKRRIEIEASIQKLTKDYDSVETSLGKIKKLIQDSEGADKAISSLEGFRDKQQVAGVRKDLNTIQNRRDIIEKDLAQREEELALAKKKWEERKFAAFFGSGKGLAVALAILAGGIIGVIAGLSYFLSLIILGAVLVAIAVRAKVSTIRDRTNIAVVQERIQKMKDALVDLHKEEHELLAKVKCTTVVEFNQKERKFYDCLDKKASAELQLQGMLDSKTVEELEKQKREIARKLATEEANLTDDLKQTRLSQEKYVELERKVQNLEKRQADLEDQKRRCEITIEQARFNIEDQISLEEELERLRDSLKCEERKMKAYEIAKEFISKARTEILSSAGEILEKEIQKCLAIFTNDKYKLVKVNKEDLEFWVYSDEKGDWVKPEELSGGAIDEFYLAFRLALVKLIFQDKKPPLLLDDPFVNFDSVRLSKTLNFLKTLASEYQIIIFTLSDSYDKVADNIILLGDK